MRVTVRDYPSWGSVVGEHFFGVTPRDSLAINGFVAGDEEGGFATVVVRDCQNAIIALGFWEVCDQVQCNR
jgi:hypothetical protein